MVIAQLLIDWYLENKRDLPWRNTSDPYYIWLSEIILQQTKVAQGLDYYLRFISKYPNIKSLAKAPEDDVLKLWQGLGYYSRARNLHYTAKQIVHDFNGVFPETFDNIKKLKGIGNYTAAAIASFAFNIPVPVVDGNVYRVLSRLFEIDGPVNTVASQKQFFNIAEKLIDKSNPGTFNQAIMEFGALNCTPSNPICEKCPLQKTCKAYNNKTVSSFPVKSKTKQKDRFFNYLFIRNGNMVYVNKRTAKDIWINLFDFPLIESNKLVTFKELSASEKWNEIFDTCDFVLLKKSTLIKHKLSHQNLHVIFYQINIFQNLPNPHKAFKLVSVDNLYKLAVPKLIEDYIVTVEK